MITANGVRGDQGEAVIFHLKKVVRQNAFLNFAIPKLQPDPQALHFRAGQEDPPGGGGCGPELANERDGLDLAVRKGGQVALLGEQLDARRLQKGNRVKISGQGFFFEPLDDCLLSRGAGHLPFFYGNVSNISALIVSLARCPERHCPQTRWVRSEEHTSELQSPYVISS